MGELVIGAAVGKFVGDSVVGNLDGEDVGWDVTGWLVGFCEGEFVLGEALGILLGLMDGHLEGVVVGLVEGLNIGSEWQKKIYPYKIIVFTRYKEIWFGLLCRHIWVIEFCISSKMKLSYKFLEFWI